jgi:outer membrane protein assembly factor BamD (BamD/ComL family)
VAAASFTNVAVVSNGGGAAAPALESAAMIFARANKDRTAGDHQGARAAYATLFRRFPMSPEGMLAHATLGRMLLDDGDPSGALVELDTYLAQGHGALREPVLAARATALGRQGRKSAEVEAWNRLLDEYPSSLYASRAHARIEQSGGT